MKYNGEKHLAGAFDEPPSLLQAHTVLGRGRPCISPGVSRSRSSVSIVSLATTPSILLIDSAVVHRSARAHEEAHPHPDVQDPTFCRDILATSNRWCRHGVIFLPAHSGDQMLHAVARGTAIENRAILPLCHAATDVPSFFHALSLMGGLSHPKVVFGGQLSGHRYRRNVVDYALISLRIAVEQGQSTATAQHVPLTGSRRGSIIPVTNSIIWCFAHLEKEMAADSTPHDSYR
ncbi:hypothetical protein N7470_005478 [Penicillium chermesinum]|nr:hypothetical protein N7470_005478 [Penicillium chermesinum]